MALPAHDRMAHVLVDFIHRHARSISDEIRRAEAAIQALPGIDLSPDGEPSDPEAWCMLWKLSDRVDWLRELSSLRRPLLDIGCGTGGHAAG